MGLIPHVGLYGWAVLCMGSKRSNVSPKHQNNTRLTLVVPYKPRPLLRGMTQVLAVYNTADLSPDTEFARNWLTHVAYDLHNDSLIAGIPWANSPEHLYVQRGANSDMLRSLTHYWWLCAEC